VTTPGGIWKQITGVGRAFLERADGPMLLGTSDGLWRIEGETVERIAPTAGLGGNFTALLVLLLLGARRRFGTRRTL
jgi:hypothetical protein